MRVAFCFSGLTRGLDISKDFWLNQVKKYNADVFASFWDDNPLDIEAFNELFKPKKIEVENYDILKSTTFDYINNELEPVCWLGEPAKINCKNGHVFSMWYKIWRCNLLTKTEPKYDIIVRCRLDSVLDDLFMIEKNGVLNIPMGMTEVGVHAFGPNDMLAYGSVTIMDYYCTLFMKLQSYLREGKAFYPVENLLMIHLSEQDLVVNLFKSHIYLTRNMEIPFNNYINQGSLIKTKNKAALVEIKNTYYKHYEIDFTQG